MSVTVTVTEVADNDIIITSNKVIVTTHTGVVLANATANTIGINPTGTITATNVQDALEQLADQKFVQDTAPTTADPNLDEGDLWYNTVDDKLMVYRNTNWEELILAAQLEEGSDAAEYEDISLNGGYF